MKPKPEAKNKPTSQEKLQATWEPRSKDGLNPKEKATAEMEATPSARVVHFKWEVNAESQGDFFIIEKSLDQENWSEVRRVESIQNHNERHTYEISEINFAEASRLISAFRL